MGDLSKLKVAVGQPELTSGRPSLNEQARERMVNRALDAGADLLVMPGSLEDPHDIHLVVLNDSRLDVAGNAVHLEACGEMYRIGLEPDDATCDFAVICDVTPWTLDSKLYYGQGLAPVLTIYLKPVGMCNVGKKVLAFDGGSCIVDETGRVISRLRDDFEEDMLLLQFGVPGQTTEPCTDKPLACLVKTMRRFDQQVLPWGPRWVIGLSGGLDSSIVAALLTKAFGPERVVGYNLATRYNSDATKANAADLAKALGIQLRNGSIEALVDATGATVQEYGYPPEVMQGLVLENVQARLRGHLLSTFAAIEGGVVANNGNRVECALGYATLYGDAIGALAPIGDLTKVRLFELAHIMNRGQASPVIPENLLPNVTLQGYDWETPPSAELADGQKDPMKWFYHDWLITQLLEFPSLDEAACDIMQRYLVDHLQDSEVEKWVRFYGLDDPKAFLDDLDWVMNNMCKAAFKRIQAPPAITIASPASVAAEPDRQGVFEPSQRMLKLRAKLLSL